MKAMMSYQRSPLRQGTDILARINNYSWELEQDAVSEARAILAETEPTGKDGEACSLEAKARFYTCAVEMTEDEQVILAEALATFLSESGESL